MAYSLRKSIVVVLVLAVLFVMARSCSRGETVKNSIGDATPVFRPAPTTTVVAEIVEEAAADDFPPLPEEAATVAREVAHIYLTWHDPPDLPNQLQRLRALTAPEVYPYMERDLLNRQPDSTVKIDQPVLEAEIDAFSDKDGAVVAVVVYTQRVTLVNVGLPEATSQQPGVLSLRLMPYGDGWIVAGYS
jgi:hypothetical protein